MCFHSIASGYEEKAKEQRGEGPSGLDIDSCGLHTAEDEVHYH